MPTFISGGAVIQVDELRPSAVGLNPAILLIHGSGGNASFWADRMAPHLTRLNIALYVVHYFDRTETVRADIDTIRDGYHFPIWLSTLHDALAYIRTRPGVNPDRIALLGISLGAYLSLTLATDPTACIRAVVEISGGLPEPWAVGATDAFPPTLILHGSADTVVPVSEAQALDGLLTRLGVPHSFKVFAGEGHWFTPVAQMQMLLAIAQFLAAHL